MAWTSLSSRLASLPLVLAGPIVRKTTSTSVSVWIALKEEVSSLELVILSGTTIIGRSTTSSKRFGRNLHIALITVNGLTLTVGTKYFYNINFGNSRSLITPGVLSLSPNINGIAKIVYGGQSLPSFVLPLNNMTSLKIIHASCRKPHGGIIHSDDTDGFKAIDDILSNTINELNDPLPGIINQANTRPQQLYLTGDQIYADDVSDILLFMLRDAEKTLLGWPTREQLPSAPNSLNLSPLHRLPLITKARFSCAEQIKEDEEKKVGKSHLLRLGEFYSMYLFVWSQELWPTVWAQDLTPTEPFFPLYGGEYKDYADDSNDEAFKLKGEYTPEKYYSKTELLRNFFETISSARRVLANISTYMIFDDHEITDDWNLTLPWVNDVYGSLDGTRIIQNGLSAYAVFQGWGNKPESFSNATSDAKLLNALVTLNQHGEAGSSQDVDWGDIAKIVKPLISGTDLTGGIDWSYSLSFDKFDVIALNARTNRALFKTHAGLLSKDAMKSQIADRVQSLKNDRTRLNLDSPNFTIIIAPAPVFGLELMEAVIQRAIAHYKGPNKGDFEPWSADRNTLEEFLKEISAFRRVLLLSGDVHYAFSNSVDYWDLRSGSEIRSKFVNLTSSSLKNSTSGPPDGTTFLAGAINNHIPEIFLHIKNDGSYVGWNNAGPNYIKWEVINQGVTRLVTEGTVSVDRGNGPGIAHWYKLNTEPIIVPNLLKGYTRINEWVDPSFPPDWEYTIIFKSDSRGDADRMAGTMPTLSPRADVIGSGSRHGTIKIPRGNHTIVGEINIGEITFQWGTTENDKKVVHKIWSKVDGKFIPHTIHLVDFGIASATDQKPSQIGRTP